MTPNDRADTLRIDRRDALALISGALLTSTTSAASAVGRRGSGHNVTIDDLVRREEVLLATLTRDGGKAAYLVARADPISRSYDFEVRVAASPEWSAARVIDSYSLNGSEAFNEYRWLNPKAGAIEWLGRGELLYTVNQRGASSLKLLDSNGEVRTLLQAFDEIEFEVLGDGDVRVRTAKATSSLSESVPDLARRAEDGDRPFGTLQRQDRRVLETKLWSFGVGARQLNELRSLATVDQPDENAAPPRLEIAELENAADESIAIIGNMTSPDGAKQVAVYEVYSSARSPGRSYSAASIISLRDGVQEFLLPLLQPKPQITLLGWSGGSDSVVYLSVTAECSEVRRVHLDGRDVLLYRTEAGLQKPGMPFARADCVVQSADQRHLLLLTSTNCIPSKLALLDTEEGVTHQIDVLNEAFVNASCPKVRFYRIPNVAGDAWGRLYLPNSYSPGDRYPLVITQYGSGPGFEAAVGDEIPILSLTAHGMAVFALHSLELAIQSTKGDFNVELARLQRPLDAMEWVIRELDRAGIIDPNRVALTGTSYGSEVAMYAYWRSRLFRTISSTSGSFHPVSLPFGGPAFLRGMHEKRGFPLFEETDLSAWRLYSATLNASPNLPPLLFQSPDRAPALVAGAWSLLRFQGAQVEWYEYPDEGHVKVDPANRWWTYSRNLDWLRFWLQDVEDQHPTKSAQYERWRRFRQAQRAPSAN